MLGTPRGPLVNKGPALCPGSENIEKKRANMKANIFFLLNEAMLERPSLGLMAGRVVK